MAKTKGKKPRTRRSSWRKRIHRTKAKPPFELLIGAATIPFTGAAGGFASPIECLQSGDMVGLMDNMKVGFLGFDPARNASTPNIMALANPFDMEHGRYLKIMLYAGIAGMIRKKLVPKSSQLFKKIPLIGRWVS